MKDIINVIYRERGIRFKMKNKYELEIRKELKNKTVLITGGAGSVGFHLTKRILEYPVKSVRILDINEAGLFDLGRSIKDKRIRLLLGSILDKERIDMAGSNVDVIFHTAAIKNIEISEYNPIETIETNINGTVNMIKMAMNHKPEKFINISTDKAAEPTTLYGTTKQIGERLTSWTRLSKFDTKFSSVRFGNIFESRGNVFEVWEEEKRKDQPLSITDPTMKRYLFHIDEAVNFILKCLTLTKGGEIFVPKMREYDIKSLAGRISKNHKIIGKRPGEKVNEILISDTEKKKAREFSDMWII